MDGSHFDKLIRPLAATRRSLISGALALGASWHGGSGTAARRKKKRRKRRPKAKPNAYGCLNVGDPCKSAEQCCSGVCDGKKGKRRCLAHGAGTCQQDGLGYCTAANPSALTCNDEPNCLCFHTTAGSTFCGDATIGSGIACSNCQRDADCASLGFPPGSACAPFATGICQGTCFTDMVCVAPCGAALPEPSE